jgi:hypothetical protein
MLILCVISWAISSFWGCYLLSGPSSWDTRFYEIDGTSEWWPGRLKTRSDIFWITAVVVCPVINIIMLMAISHGVGRPRAIFNFFNKVGEWFNAPIRSDNK